MNDLFCQVCDNLSPYAAQLSKEPQQPKSDGGGGILKFLQDKKDAAAKYLRDARKPKEAVILHPKANIEETADVAGNSKETKEENRNSTQENSDVSNNELPSTTEGATGIQASPGPSADDQIIHSAKPKEGDVVERDSSAPKGKPPQISRQKSRQTKIVRKDQITEAHDRWKDIVQFCEDVSRCLSLFKKSFKERCVGSIDPGFA